MLALSSLGMALAAESPGLPAEPDQAIMAFHRGMSVATAIRDKDPNNALAVEDLMMMRSHLGAALAVSHPAEGIAALESARDEILTYSGRHPDDFNIQKTLTDVYNDLGQTQRLSHRPELALQQHLAALKLADRILADSPADGISGKARVIALIRAANDELDLGRLPPALARLDLAQKDLSKMVRSTPADASLSELTAEAGRIRAEAQKNFAKNSSESRLSH